MTKYYDSSLTEINLPLSINMPLDKLIETLDEVSDKTESNLLVHASDRLAHVATALTCLQDALFYVSMYKSTDSTGEGEKRRQQLIDDSETIIGLIRTGGLYP
jgi:hypothetical protein